MKEKWTAAEAETTQVFVVRIWVEPWAGAPGTKPEWRGVIEHVPGGEQRHFHNLNVIREFIIPYLEAMGIQSSRFETVKSWFQRRCRR